MRKGAAYNEAYWIRKASLRGVRKARATVYGMYKQDRWRGHH